MNVLAYWHPKSLPCRNVASPRSQGTWPEPTVSIFSGQDGSPVTAARPRLGSDALHRMPGRPKTGRVPPSGPLRALNPGATDQRCRQHRPLPPPRTSVPLLHAPHPPPPRRSPARGHLDPLFNGDTPACGGRLWLAYARFFQRRRPQGLRGLSERRWRRALASPRRRNVHPRPPRAAPGTQAATAGATACGSRAPVDLFKLQNPVLTRPRWRLQAASRAWAVGF
jgi:hypothetical protein